MSRYATRTNNTALVKDFLKQPKENGLNSDSSWTRPAEWLTMPDTSSGEKIAILIAVYDNPTNYFAITISGAYNIDWGDGTNTNYATGVKASKDFSYSAITTDTSTQKNTLFRGYRQQLIVITPQGGSNLTSVNFNVKHSSDTRSSSYRYDSQILDIQMVGSNVTTLTMGSSSANVRHNHLENFEYTGSNGVTTLTYGFYESGLRRFVMDCSAVTNLSYTFALCYRLTDVTITTDSSLTTTERMFSNCVSLKAAPYFDTSAVTNCSYMFTVCYSLEYIPQYNWAAATTVDGFVNSCHALEVFSQSFPAATSGTSLVNGSKNLRVAHINAPSLQSWSGIFRDCYSLIEVGYMPSASVTTFQGAFRDCRSLKEIPWVIDCTSATILTEMFMDCPSLVHVEGFSNTTGITSAGHMYNGCHSLEKAPDMNFDTSLTSLPYTFANCSSLKTLPDFGDTSAVTSWPYFAYLCYSLKEVPSSYDFTSAASMAGTFQGCTSLRTVPEINGNPTDTSSMFQSCTALTSAPVVGMSNTTTLSSMFSGCVSLKETPTSYASVKATTVSGMFTSCHALSVGPDVDTRLVANGSGSYLPQGGSLQEVLKTEFPQSINVSNTRLSASQLDAIYTLLPDRTARTINNVTASGGTVTYTTTAAHGYQKGMTITVTGVNPTAYNLATVLIASVPTSTTFTVTNAATGTYVSGGTVTPAALTITVTGAVGASGDTPTIATAKGWTVTG